MLIDPAEIRRAQTGNPDAFHAVVRAYQPRIVNTLHRLLGDRWDSRFDEIAPRLIQGSLERTANPRIFEPHLYRLVVNTAYDYLRSKRLAS